MIKNIILDVGGVIFDDSKKNLEKLLGKNCDALYKTVYGKGFKKCLLGELTIEELISNLKDEKDYKDIKYILSKENLTETYPLIKESFDYIKSLKEQGYNLFLLTNITEDSYNYINSIISLKDIFTGGIYSYQEHLKKPSPEFYELLITRFNLKKEETIFFDDREKNVKAANEIGIKSIKFTHITDIENNL